MSASSSKKNLMQITSVSNSNQQAEQEEEEEEEEEKRGGLGLKLADGIPRDIWSNIGKRLESRLDVLRFRSVCRTWRSWLPAPLRFPLMVPRPPGPWKLKDSTPNFISELTFYATNDMIVVFEEEYRGGQFSASAFVHQKQIPDTKFELPPFTQISNLSFLSNAYHVHVAFPRVDNKFKFVANVDVLKIVIICDCWDGPINPNYPRLGHLKVVAHLINRKLAVLTLRGGAMNNSWETGFCNTSFVDIVSYRGQLYAVDNYGSAFVMDFDSSSMTQVAPPLPNSVFAKLQGLQGNRKVMHLAVVSGDLYMFINEADNILTPRLYKLSSRLKGQWLEADQDLPDQVFIQNLQCNFAVARDLLIPRHNNNPKYEVPRFCSWPKFVYVRVAVGFDNVYDQSATSARFCDIQSLPYSSRASLD